MRKPYMVRPSHEAMEKVIEPSRVVPSREVQRFVDGNSHLLKAALANHLDQPIAELTPEVQDRVKRTFPFGIKPIQVLWSNDEGSPYPAGTRVSDFVYDDLSPVRRQAIVEQYHWERDPANEFVREELWELQVEIENDITCWQAKIDELAPPAKWQDGPKAYRKELGRLKDELAAVKDQQRELLSAGVSELQFVIERLNRVRDPRRDEAPGKTVAGGDTRQTRDLGIVVDPNHVRAEDEPRSATPAGAPVFDAPDPVPVILPAELELDAWHQGWAVINPLASDDDAVKAARAQIGHHVTVRQITALRKPKDGSPRKKGPKVGKTYKGPRVY